MSGRYVFHSQWHIEASADSVYDTLRDVASYPTWWPQVRSVRQLDETSGELCCRSLLPYDLTFVIRREIEDRGERILQAHQSGDLEGTSRWTVTANGAGSVAAFDEDVVVRNALVRHAGLIARPILRVNHDLMMREGERGLRRYLRTPTQ